MNPLIGQFLDGKFEDLWKAFKDAKEKDLYDASEDDKVWIAAIPGRYLLLLLQDPYRFVGVISKNIDKPITLVPKFVVNMKKGFKSTDQKLHAIVYGIDETSLVTVGFGSAAIRDIKKYLKGLNGIIINPGPDFAPIEGGQTLLRFNPDDLNPYDTIPTVELTLSPDYGK